MMHPAGPVYTADLLAGLHDELMVLLRGLDAAEWREPTVCGSWSVQDVASHILDGYVRRLSPQAPPPDTDLSDYRNLVAYLNRLNANWVDAMRRVSPRLLIEFLAVTGPQTAALLASLDPAAPARFPVAWAGEESSPNWFDIGREYTEQWHHQQQIRDAVRAPGLMARQWLHPVLSLFVRALPRSYRDIAGGPGEAVNIAISGDAGIDCALENDGSKWILFEGSHPSPVTLVRLTQDSAWRLFTNQFDRKEALRRMAIDGRRDLGEAIATARAVMV